MESPAWIIFHEFCLGKSWKPIKIFHFYQVETVIEIFSNENCQVTFSFEYIKYITILNISQLLYGRATLFKC